MADAGLVRATRPTVAGTRSTRRAHIVVHTILIVGAIGMIVPFFWEMSTALKTYAESSSVPPTWLPARPIWENFSAVFADMPFAAQFANTAIMTVLRTAGQVLFCSAAGYAFAKLQFPGRNVLFMAFLSILMIPSQLFLLSQFQLMQRFGLLNSVAALVLPGIFSAFGTFLMRQFFMQIPQDLDDAARLDGCNPLQIWWNVMLPLAKNGLLALGILTAIWSWNDLLWPLVVNSDPEKMTLSAGLSALQGQFLTNYPVLMAGSFLASIPMITLFIVFQRNMLQGIVFSGIKG
jgi:multiple sugar transport system permease protein